MWNRRRIERTRDGTYALRFPAEERELLRQLPDQLRTLLEVAPEDPTLRRLFPHTYEDEQDEAAFREVVGDDLLDTRRRALQVVAETADAERLTAEQAQSWLTALNDLRLVLGTRLDVQEAPKRDADRAAREEETARVKQDKARLENKPTFRP